MDELNTEPETTLHEQHDSEAHSDQTSAAEGTADFASLGLGKQLLSRIEALGWSEPTEIQRIAIPAVLAGHDLYGVAQTGTGKTGAFVLPILEKLADAEPAQTLNPYCIVLSPTRELVMQIAGQFTALAEGSSVRVATIFGGTAENPQIEALSAGVEVLVGAPGRVLDLMGRGWLQFRELRFCVLDEADRMFDMGFINDIRSILNRMPSRRQTLLFTATLPEGVKKLAREYLFYPQEIRVGRTAPPTRLTHQIVPVTEDNKERALTDILREDFDSVIVFCRTKRGAEQLGRRLIREGERCAILHADRTQMERTKAFERFRSGDARVLVATDVASRGLDIDDIGLVVNFDVPLDPEDYVHRIGRTARAKKQGLALTFVTQKEIRYLRRIEAFLKQNIEERGGTRSENYVPQDSPPASRQSPPAGRSGSAGRSSSSSSSRGGRGRSRPAAEPGNPPRQTEAAAPPSAVEGNAPPAEDTAAKRRRRGRRGGRGRTKAADGSSGLAAEGGAEGMSPGSESHNAPD